MCALFPEINLLWYINVTDRRQKGQKWWGKSESGSPGKYGQRVQELGKERTGGGSSKRVGRGQNRGNYATIESHDAEKVLWGIIYVLTIKLSSLHVRQ